MTVFGKYLYHIIKKSFLKTVVFSLFSVMATTYVVGTSSEKNYSYITGIWILATILGIFSTIIPILETSCFKSRRNVDTLYFLPITRIKLALAHYINGFLQVFVIYTVSFINAYFILLGQAHKFSLNYLLPYYLLSVLAGLLMYSFFIWIANNANSNTDAVITSILWMFAGWLAIELIYASAEGWLARVAPAISDLPYVGLWGIVYAPINNLTMIFQSYIERPSFYFMRNVEIIISQRYMFIVWSVICVICGVAYFYSFAKKRAEDAGEISDNTFGYRLLIPLYAYILNIMIRFGNLLSIIIWLMTFISYVIFRRSFKIRKADIVNTVVPIFITRIENRDISIVASIMFFAYSAYRLIYLIAEKRKGKVNIAKKDFCVAIVAAILSFTFVVLSVIYRTIPYATIC